jgi:excisionase family DNA binding protein
MSGAPALMTVDALVGVLQRMGVTGIGRSRLYSMIDRGEIPTIKLGRKVLVVRRRLEEAWGIELGENGSGE